MCTIVISYIFFLILRARFQRRMDEIKSYMTVRKVPAQLRLEIQEYFMYYYKKRTALEEANILDMLTPQLKDKMRNFLVKDTLDTIGFFKTLDNNAVMLLLAVLKPLKVINDARALSLFGRPTSVVCPTVLLFF